MSNIKKCGVLKILGHTVTVFQDPDLFLNEGNIGSWLYHRRSITMDGSLDAEVRQEKLWHEIFEAANELLELKMSHHQITALGTVVNQVLSDNDVNIFVKR